MRCPLDLEDAEAYDELDSKLSEIADEQLWLEGREECQPLHLVRTSY
jgi:hypothetical protein